MNTKRILTDALSNTQKFGALQLHLAESGVATCAVVAAGTALLHSACPSRKATVTALMVTRRSTFAMRWLPPPRGAMLQPGYYPGVFIHLSVPQWG